MCLRKWHTKISEEVLRLRIPKDKLKTMRPVDRVKTVYQCDMASEFQDTTRARANNLHWEAVNKWQLAKVDPVKSDKAMISLFKTILTQNAFFTLPENFFDAWLAGGAPPGFDTVGPQFDARTGLMHLAGETIPELFPDGQVGLQVFCIENPTPETRSHLVPSHTEELRSTIHVSRVDVLSGLNNYTELLVMRTGVCLRLDVAVLCRYLQNYLPSLFRWSIAQVNTTLRERSHPLAIGSGAPMLPAIVDLRVGASSSDEISTAMAPYQPPELATTSEERFALAQLAYCDGIRREVPLKMLVDVKVDTIESLRSKSVALVRTDEFGEAMVSINPQGVQAEATFILRSCIPAFKYQRPGDQLKLGYLYQKIRLIEDGWEEGKPDNDYQPDGEKIFRPTTSPISYFVALRESASLFSKGVDKIQHDGKDLYYRCLLRLPAEAIVPFLESMAEKPDAWFKKQLLAICKESDPVLQIEDEPEPAPEVLPDLGIQSHAIVPITVDRVPWRDSEFQRCWIRLDHVETKIWFDNCSAPSGQRRGWANCPTHRCGCLRAVTRSRDHFAVALALWLKHGIDDEHMTKAEHLRFWPTEEAIAEAMPRATFRPF